MFLHCACSSTHSAHKPRRSKAITLLGLRGFRARASSNSVVAMQMVCCDFKSDFKKIVAVLKTLQFGSLFAAQCATLCFSSGRASVGSPLLLNGSGSSRGERGQRRTCPRATVRTNRRPHAVTAWLLQARRCVSTRLRVKSHRLGTRSLRRVRRFQLPTGAQKLCACLPAHSAGVAPRSLAVPCRCSPRFLACQIWYI